MKEADSHYDWIIVGGGVAGIATAEILCREGKRVLLIEKNKKLASETSKVFHEWMHSGSLYTLAPDHLLTLRYLLGATDDLLEFYSSFPKMNLNPTEEGIRVSSEGWFNNHNIHYRYRLHKLNPIWMMVVSRSIELTKLISKHDWIRKNAGGEYGLSVLKLRHWFINIYKQIATKEKFLNIISPDITMNSRQLVSDFVNHALHNGLEIIVDSEVTDIQDNGKYVAVITEENKYVGANAVMCSPDIISKFMKLPIKVSYAPIAVVEGLNENQNSFVELDYNIRKCINLIVKENGIGQAGGISLDRENEIPQYFDYVISELQKRVHSLKVIDSYVGLKKELVQKGENRNYLYHINRQSKNLWSIVLGKFSLAFSMAPEFYRRVYHKNPTTKINPFPSSEDQRLVSKTEWQEIVIRNKG